MEKLYKTIYFTINFFCNTTLNLAYLGINRIYEVICVSKTKRNDPCTCGSGKKFKRWCGENVITFSTKSYNNELESLLEGLIDFAMTYFESTLVTYTQEYIEQNLREYDSDELDAYVGLISAWLILNKPIENGQTVFDLYYSRKKNKVKHIRTKRVFETWGNAEASVFEVISVENKFSSKVTIRDVWTEEIYELTDIEATKDVIGQLLIGILLPFVQQNEFFFGALESPREENDFIFNLLEEIDENHMNLNESFPEFLAIVLDPPRSEERRVGKECIFRMLQLA